MELIDLVNFDIIFLLQTTLLKWVIFLLGPLTLTFRVLLFWIYFFFLTYSIFFYSGFPPLGSSDVLYQFPLTFLQTDYSRADWDGLRDHLSYVLWEVIFKLVLLRLPLNFVSGSRLELIYVSLIGSIRSSLIHCHVFQLRS